MSRTPPRSPTEPPTLAVKLGRIFEARATGWGILAVPIVLFLLLGGAYLGLTLR
jgi:hypothetical protein